MLLEGSIFILPNGTFFAELILFVAIFGVIGKVVLPPIQRTLAERDRMVRSSLQAGEEGRHEAERLAAEREAVLSRARAEAREHFDAVALANEELRADARSRAEAERARLVADAAGALETERRQARTTAMAELPGLVVAAATRVLDRPVDPARHQAILAEVAEAGAARGR